jgi:PAS domain S-box-containing protein
MTPSGRSNTREEILAVFENVTEPTPLTTTEVADALDWSHQTAYDTLTEFADTEGVHTKKVGPRERVWWRSTQPEQSVEQFSKLTESVEEYAIFTLNSDGKVTSWNKGAQRIKGYTEDEIIGEHFSVFYTDDDREKGVPEANLADATAHGDLKQTGWRVRKNGERFWADVTITALQNDAGKVTGYLKVTRDNTERYEYEVELRHERNLREQILEASPVGISALTPDGEIVLMNDQAAAIVGTAKDERLGDTYEMAEWSVYDEDGDPTPPEDRVFNRVRETGDSVSDFISQIERPDGSHVWLSVNGTPVYDSSDNLSLIILTYKDITQLKEHEHQVEKERDALKQELQDVFDRFDDALFGLDDRYQFTYLNKPAEQILETTEANLLGTEIWDTYPKVFGYVSRSKFERALQTQEAVSFETFSDPLDAWFSITAYPSETGLSVYCRNITEQKEYERELERYKTLVETVNDGVYTVDTDGHFTMVNEAYAKMTGYTREELLGTHVSTVADEETVETARDFERELVAGERETVQYEADVRTADGGTIRAEATFAILQDGTGDYERAGVVRDITERVERERELAQFKRAVEAAGHAIYITDTDGIIMYVNPAFEQTTGFTEDEALGQIPRILQSSEHDDAYYHQLWETVMAGEVWTEEIIDRRKSGEKYHAHQTIAPVTDDTGNVDRFVAIHTDISERKQREKELAEQVTQQSVVAEFGQRSLEVDDLDVLFEEATELISDTLGTTLCKILEQRPNGGDLLLRAGVGWQDGLVGTATVGTGEDSQAGYTLQSEEPVIVEDLTTETRFSGPPLLHDHDVVSGISVIIGSLSNPWGVLGTHQRFQREFTIHEVEFVQSIANILAVAINRARRNLLYRITRSIGEADSYEDGLQAALDEVCTVTDWEYGEVWSKSDDEFEFLVAETSDDHTVDSFIAAAADYRFGYGEDLVGRVGETETPEWIDDIATASSSTFVRTDDASTVGLNAALGVPIIAEDEVVAVLVFAMTEVREKNDWLIESVTSIANELGELVIRRQTEWALEREKELVEQMLETNPLGIIVLTADGEFVRVNSTAEHLFGRTRDELLGQSIEQSEWRVFDEDDQPIPVEDQPIAQMLETKEPVRNWEVKFKRLDGHQLWLSVNAAPIALPDGTITYVVFTTEDITEQKHRETELKRQTKALQPLNRYNTIVREITEAAVEESTPTKIEQVICETFASFDQYAFALIGEFTPDSDQFIKRSWAGIAEADVETLLRTSPGRDLQTGLGSVAAQTNRVQVTQLVSGRSTVDDDPLASDIAELDYQAVAFIPLSTNDVVHGVLSVYATSPFAFDETEVALLEELGRTIGLSIAAVRTRQLLHATTITELNVQITGTQDVFLTVSREASCILTLDLIVPINRESYLAYVTVEGTAPDRVAEVVVDAPEVIDVQVVKTDDEQTCGKLEMHLLPTASLAQIIEYGAEPSEFVVDDGIGQLAVAIPSREDTQSLLRWLYQVFDEIQFESLQEIPWSPRKPTWSVDVLDIGLTDRQREAVEAAYHAGYFEWPRGSTAEEVAESMGVSPPTFHNHLRKGEQKVVAAFVERRGEQAGSSP